MFLFLVHIVEFLFRSLAFLLVVLVSLAQPCILSVFRTSPKVVPPCVVSPSCCCSFSAPAPSSPLRLSASCFIFSLSSDSANVHSAPSRIGKYFVFAALAPRSLILPVVLRFLAGCICISCVLLARSGIRGFYCIPGVCSQTPPSAVLRRPSGGVVGGLFSPLSCQILVCSSGMYSISRIPSPPASDSPCCFCLLGIPS